MLHLAIAHDAILAVKQMNMVVRKPEFNKEV